MTLKSRLYGAPGVVAAVALLSGCFLFEDTRSAGGRAPEPDTTAAVATFNPTRESAPFPANFLFGFDSQSGLLQVDAPDNPFLNALRDLNGFSTIEPWTTRFTAALAPETLPEGVRVFVLDGVQPPVEVEDELVFGQDFVAGLQDDGRQLVISPLQPLEPGTNYLVVLTDGLRSADGGAVVNSLSYRALKGTEALEGEAARLQALTDAELSAVEAFDSSLERANVVLSWSVRTQNIGHTLQAARVSFEDEQAGNRQLHLAPLQVNGEPVPAPGGGAALWVGTVNLRYGLGVPTDPGNPDDPVGLPAAAPVLSTHWLCNGASCNTAAAIGGGLTYDATVDDLWVPVVAAVPTDDGAGEPYPVVLFKHGLRQNRADIVAVANQFAELGYVTVAIDLPLHGIVRDQVAETDPIKAVTELLRAESVNALIERSDVTERTFYVDVEGDNAVDPSGSHFLNVSQPLVLRDNLGQAAADMMALRRALTNLTLPEGES
ncbi:hypothetical protein, partial [Aquisalimonas sp.]|uniref:hypothetical protein n=1 Tax=Aquisalimonas sp. TaxID=1872621 RepID=UPI0025C01584